MYGDCSLSGIYYYIYSTVPPVYYVMSNDEQLIISTWKNMKIYITTYDYIGLNNDWTMAIAKMTKTRNTTKINAVLDDIVNTIHE